MKNKIKITVTEKHLDDAIEAIDTKSSQVPQLMHCCVMAKAVKEQWNAEARFCRQVAFVGYGPGRAQISISKDQRNAVTNIVDMFDDYNYDALRACLPVTLEFVEV